MLASQQVFLTMTNFGWHSQLPVLTIKAESIFLGKAFKRNLCFAMIIVGLEHET